MQINISGLSQRSTVALDKVINTSDIDICAIQETLHNQSLFSNYSVFYNKNQQSNPGRGVGLIIKKQLQPQAVLNSDRDAVWALTTLPSGSRCLVGSIYFNPSKSSSHFENLIAEIENAIQFRKSQSVSHMMVLGDWNARNTDWGDKLTNDRGKILRNFLENERRISDIAAVIPNGDTFKCTNGGSIIDLCLMDKRLIQHLMHSSIDSEVELFSGAPIRGHFPVTHVLSLPQRSSKSTSSRKLSIDLENTDWNIWKKSLEDAIAEKLEQSGNLHSVKKIWEVLLQSIQLTNSTAAAKKVICDYSKPFWSENLSKLSEELRKCKASMKRNQTPTNVFSYRTAKAEFSDSILREKNDWIRRKLEGLNVKDSTLFWKRYKASFSKRSDNFIGDLHDGVKLTNKTEEKEEILFKTYFTAEGLGCKLTGDPNEQHIKENYSRLMREQNKFYPDFPTKLPIDQFIKLNQSITMDDITVAIKYQKITPTAFDRDGLHPKMIKHFGPRARELLMRLCKGLFNEEKWTWDYSRVSFIKKPDKDCYTKPGSFRPITVSSYVGKIVERIIEKRLRILCGLQNIIDDEQEGFCAGRSTTRYLYKLIATLKEAQRKRLNAIILCIDLQKAFDSVWIPGLIVKLNNLGVEGKILRIVNSFLCNRNVSLCVNDYQGKPRKCSLFGLPQGSVLSPLLFIIFISDMLNFRLVPCSDQLKECSCFFKYADDGTLTFIHEDIAICYSLAQEACNHISVWCKHWKLQVNCAKNKTEAIVLGGKPLTPIADLMFGNDPIRYVSKSKVLGLIIDENLSFQPHAKMQVKNCWFAWYNIIQNTTTMRGLNVSSLSILFKSVVLTKLLYAGQVWLGDNLNIFKDLWSRAMLKISGSEYHPKRVIIEVATGIQPLKLQLESITVKFLIKCMQDTQFNGLIFQIESNRAHPYHHQMISLMDYIKWKRKTIDRRLCLQDIDIKEICYTKILMSQYIHQKWTYIIKDDLQPSEILDELEDSALSIQVQQNTQKLLFPRSSSRFLDTHLMAYLHGSSMQFNKFRNAIMGAIASPNCSVCTGCIDDPYHRLYNCPLYDCIHRDKFPITPMADRKLVALNLLLKSKAEQLCGLRRMVQSILNAG